ncbi:MAG: AAA family ATPase, partial [Candidatus Thiodiazotropha sp. (ex Lucinoma annulata)]|nr:AAA family ATPase [Candidatus Thiodiazotropha sp. (ex Lucinoma annulata)]
MLYFHEIGLSGWRQFDNVQIDLSRQTTVLTGANGCGKTTILNVLSNHFGWNINFTATPFIGKKKKKKIFSDLKKIIEKEEPNNAAESVGSIKYSNEAVCQLNVPANSSKNPQYKLQYGSQQPAASSQQPAASSQQP